MAPEVADIVLDDIDYSSRFVSWVATQCLDLSQKKNRLALYNSLMLKAGGASQAALSHTKKSQGYFLLFSSFLLVVMSVAGRIIDEFGEKLSVFETPS